MENTSCLDISALLVDIFAFDEIAAAITLTEVYLAFVSADGNSNAL